MGVIRVPGVAWACCVCVGVCVCVCVGGTRNRFDVLADRVVLDSDGVQISRVGIVKLESLLKPTKPSEKRRGRTALSSPATLTF